MRHHFIRSIFLLLCMCFTMHVDASEGFISLRGHLDNKTIENALEQIDENTSDMAIEVSSTSGNVDKVIGLAKKLYQHKNNTNGKITVYIDENALGPAAMIPFLGDEIITSHFVSWGDISLGTNGSLPTNILRNQVSSFVPETNPHATILNLMARAMADKEMIIVSDDGSWRVVSKAKDGDKVISSKGESLVVNQKQMRDFGLIDRVLSKSEFAKEYSSGITSSVTKTETTQSKQNIDQELSEHITFSDDGKNVIGRLVIDDRKTGINESTWIYVKSAIDTFIKTKPIFVILELNTPGGQVYAAQKISDALKELDTQYGIPVVAFIDNWAISAGAMLAYSCRFIIITKDAAMGAAEPVLKTSEGSIATASEKVNSALRADFANRAGFYDRNPLIAQAMVDKDIILVYRHGKIVKLDGEDDIHKEGPSRDIVISAKGKLLTFDSNELMKYDVADIKIKPTKLDPISASEKDKGQWPASKELIFQYPFFKDIPNASVKTYQMDWKTRFFSILANPFVASFLFLGLMLGFYVEINSPGFGVPGTIALIALILIVLSSMALDAMNWLELILIGVGFALIAIDLFLIPTFGLMGTVGALFLLAGILGLMIPGIETVDYEFETHTFNAAGEHVIGRLMWLLSTFVLGVILIGLLARYAMPRFAAFNRLVLKGAEEDASAGYIAGARSEDLPQAGTSGVALSALRPGGKVLINETVYDAISTGDFIPEGVSIKVEYIEGSTIMVAKA